MTLLMAGINMSQCCPHKCHFEYLKARETGPERRSMTGYEKTKYAVYNALMVGKKNARTRKDLCHAARCDDRILRDAIADLRSDGPILNNDDGKGYYIPEPTLEGYKETWAWIFRQMRRIKSMRRALKGAMKFVKRKPKDVPGQISMFEDGEIYEE